VGGDIAEVRFYGPLSSVLLADLGQPLVG
jgi:hypothetical protein